jgi:hypothetical protein
LIIETDAFALCIFAAAFKPSFAPLCLGEGMAADPSGPAQRLLSLFAPFGFAHHMVVNQY